ncbi:unnamed protein product, partial [Mesorhabditis spiculigera]
MNFVLREDKKTSSSNFTVIELNSNVETGMMPILKKSGRTLGTELLSTAANTLNDVVAGKDLRESVKANTRASAGKLVDKGYESLKKRMGLEAEALE